MKTGNKGGSAEESYEEETWVSLDIYLYKGECEENKECDVEINGWNRRKRKTIFRAAG